MRVRQRVALGGADVDDVRRAGARSCSSADLRALRVAVGEVLRQAPSPRRPGRGRSAPRARRRSARVPRGRRRGRVPERSQLLTAASAYGSCRSTSVSTTTGPAGAPPMRRESRRRRERRRARRTACRRRVGASLRSSASRPGPRCRRRGGSSTVVSDLPHPRHLPVDRRGQRLGAADVSAPAYRTSVVTVSARITNERWSGRRAVDPVRAGPGDRRELVLPNAAPALLQQLPGRELRHDDVERVARRVVEQCSALGGEAAVGERAGVGELGGRRGAVEVLLTR